MADSKFAQLTINNKKIEVPIHSPTAGPDVVALNYCACSLAN